ncbi:hypothetical protein [Xylella fastidiosa]
MCRLALAPLVDIAGGYQSLSVSFSDGVSLGSGLIPTGDEGGALPDRFAW